MQLRDDARAPFDLTSTPVHLGLGSTARPIDGFAWSPEVLEAYSEAVASDGVEGRMVMVFEADGPGDHWEVHPGGDELVVCLDGTLRVTREGEQPVVLGPGQATVNPPGAWHVVDAEGPTRFFTITAGLGTDHRPRVDGPAGP